MKIESDVKVYVEMPVVSWVDGKEVGTEWVYIGDRNGMLWERVRWQMIQVRTKLKALSTSLEDLNSKISRTDSKEGGSHHGFTS